MADAGIRKPEDLDRRVAWSITQVLALVTIALFTVATWGLFTKGGWWEAVAGVAAALGLLVLATMAEKRTAGHLGFDPMTRAISSAGPSRSERACAKKG